MQPVKSLALSGLFSTFLASTAIAQTPFDPTGTWAVGGGVEQVTLDKQQASREWIDDSATSIYFEGEYFLRRLFSVSFGLAFYMYDDYGSFNQWVEDWTGDENYTSSDASGMPIYSEIGYKQFFGNDGRTYITVRGGFSLMLSSERSISNCSNCYEEDIDIEGGFYGAVGAGVRLGDSWLLGVHHKQFFSGDIERATGLNISYQF